MPYGICMEGNEPAFERALSTVIHTFRSEPLLRLVEVGTAAGGTTRGIAAYLRARGVPFTLHTFDVPGGWSYHAAEVNEIAAQYREVIPIIHEGGMRTWFTTTEWEAPIHFAFIDGCHGLPCVQADFAALARWAVSGSQLVFHDTSVQCQGLHLQPHCQTGIAAREALQQLGLLDNRLPNWRLVEETDAAHGITVVQRL